MGIFRKLISKFTPPKGYAKVNVEFTEEEAKAIATGMERFAIVANADEQEGTMYVHPKAYDAMTAKALNDYVEDLMVELQHCREQEAIALVAKAIKSQLKVYAIHNLPIYLFQAAGMFELIGDGARAKEFFRLFLQAQTEFTPDDVDNIILKQSGFDISKLVAIAKEKV